MNIGHITATLGIDASDFQKKLTMAQQRFQTMSASFMKAGTAMSIGVTAPLLLLANKMVKAWDAAIQAETKITAVIKSTGGAAGKTTKELVNMSAALQQKTTFGDDETQAAQALLLTFTQVKGEIFNQAIPAIQDMATMLGTDLTSSAMQLGKALNDPIRGITNLRRIGVSFTEEQIAKTKALVAAGKTEEAQQLILNELQIEFGGQAEAAAKQGLGPMKQMSNNIGDLMEQFGKIILEGLKPFFTWVSKLAVKFQSLTSTQKKWVVGIAAAAAAIGPLLLIMGGLMKVFPMIVSGFNSVIVAVKAMTVALSTNPYLAAAAAIIALSVALYGAFKATNQMDAVQKRINKSMATAQVEIVKERMSLDYLFTALKHTNEGSADRARLVKTINETYGEYLPKLLTEKSTLWEIEAAQKAANAQLSLSILMKAKETALSEELEPVYEAQSDAITKVTEALLDNGYTSAAASEIMFKLVESLKQGDTYAVAFYKSMGKSTGDVLAMTGNVMDYVYDLAGALTDEKVIVNKVASAYDSLVSSMSKVVQVSGGGGGGGGGGGDGEDAVTQQIGEYEKLGKKISETESKLKDLVTLVGQGSATAEQQSQIPILTKELNELLALKKQIDETWIISSKQVKDAFDADLTDMSNRRVEASMDDRGVLEADFAARYATLDKLYAFEVAMYGHLSDEKIKLDKEYQIRREKLDSEYLLHVEEMNRKERQEKLDMIEEIRRAANDAEDVAINLRQEYYNTAIFLTQSVQEGLMDEAEKVELLSILYKKLKKDTSDAAAAAKQSNAEDNTVDAGSMIGQSLTSLPESIGDTLMAQQALRKSFRDTVAELKTQWQDGSLSYSEYMSQMTEATQQFEDDSKKIKIGKTILESLASLLKQIGTAIMSIATGKIALEQSFDKPYVALAAGAAMVAGGIALQMAIQGLASGGTVTKSGAFLVGEEGPEMVNLRAGSAVTPNHMMGGSFMGGDYELVSRIAGRDLEIIMQRSTATSITRRSR